MRVFNVLHRKIRPEGGITANEWLPTKANGNQENMVTVEGEATIAVAASAERHANITELLPWQCGWRLHDKCVAIAFQASSGQ